MKAYRQEETEPIKEGDVLTDFRGHQWVFLEVTSRRKVYARRADNEWKQEFFPSVFNLELRES